MLKRVIPYLLLLLLSVSLILPYFHAGYFPTHDGLWAVVRLGDMFRELKDHQFPPRYSGNLNFGYGYPLFNFAYPLPYYTGILLHAVHFSFINSIKILFALSVIFSGWGMYVASKKLWKNTFAAWVSAIFYLFLPYRMVDLYVRGSIGESFAFVIFPLLIVSVVRLVEKPFDKKWIVMGGSLLAALFLSHNIMAVLFTPLLAAFGLYLGWGKRLTLFSLGSAFLLGICLSAFFWAPALVEKHLILLSQVPIADRNLYYVSISSLLFPSWQYGIPGASNGFTYQIGFPLALLFLFVLFFLRKKINAIATIISLGILAMLVMLFPWSGFVWQHTPLLKEINYPWTLLGPIGFWMSLVVGYLLTLKKYWLNYVIGICLLGTVLLVVPYAHPEKYIYPDDNFFLTNDATTTSSTEYIPLWVKKWPTERAVDKIIAEKASITNLSANSRLIQFNIQSDSAQKITVNTIYYPGWIAKVDNKLVTISYNNPKGLMQLVVPQGTHVVTLKFTETPFRAAADAISLASVFFALSYFAISFIPEKKKKI